MKSAILSISLAIALIGGAFVFAKNAGSSSEPENNTRIDGGSQVIEIRAKGGYNPRMTTAKADTPTTLKIKTNGTFDCSSTLSIPALGYQANLKPSGETDIQIPPQKSGTTLQGLCAMGMYDFQIVFQ